MQNAINKGNVVLTPGTYYISKAINVGSNKIFDGNRATLKPANGKYGIEITGNGFSNVRVEIVLKNINFNLSLGAIGGIYMKDTYFVYIDDINIANMVNANAIGINIINGFNHVISNSRILGNTQSNDNNQIGINILTNSASAGLSNMTNNKYDTILIQNFKYAVKANWTVTSNMTIFENLGFSNNEYCYYLEGWADPVIINNSRMEVGSRFSTDGIELTGFYLGPSITACIDGLNAYNIQKVIESDSVKPLSIKGAVSLTGALPSGRTSKYVLFSKISGAVYLFSNIYSFSNVYDITNATGTTWNSTHLIGANSAQSAFGEITSGNSFGIYQATCSTYKTSVNILNIYGTKGATGYLWTDQDNITVWGRGNSATNLFQGFVMEPYKLYKFIAIDTNKILCYA